MRLEFFLFCKKKYSVKNRVIRLICFICVLISIIATQVVLLLNKVTGLLPAGYL